MLNFWCIAALVLLSSDSFEDRERGTVILKLGLPHSLPAVELGAKSTDLEVRRRCIEINEHWELVTASVTIASGIPKGWLAPPMIRFLPDSVIAETTREHYRNWAQAEGVINTGRWSNEIDRRATTIFLKDFLKKKPDVPTVLAIIQEAKEAEIRWHNKTPLTKIPDRPENVPTRAVNPEDDK